MKTSYSFAVIAACLPAFFSPVVIQAQSVKTVTIDLATQKPGATIKEELSETAVIQLEVVNMIPSSGRISYEISVVESDEQGNSPLPVKDYIPSKIDPAVLRANDTDDCSKTYNKALDLLLHQSKEVTVPGILSDAEADIGTACGSTGAGLYEKLEQLTVANDVMVKMLEYGKKMTITVKRGGTMWRYELTVANKKSFYFYYGLSFSPNRMTPVPTFYCQADTGGYFTISRRREENAWSYRDALPTVFYTWIPRTTFRFLPKRIRQRLTFGQKCRNFCGILLSNNVYRIGLSGGLHTNFVRPKVMFSPSIVIGKNLTLNAGVCFMQKSTLRGEYKEGQMTREFLDFDALHENVYYAEWFFSVAFRVDKSVWQGWR